MKNDREWHNRLGLSGGSVVFSGAVMNYVSGCIKRGRERLAQTFITGNSPERLTAALLHHTKDDLVFKWEPGSVPLDRLPRSFAEKQKAKAMKAADLAKDGGTPLAGWPLESSCDH